MDDRPASREESPDPAEEPLSETDQTLADNDQTLGDRDQTLSDRDQEASDEDQSASEEDVSHGGDRAAHERTSSARAEASREREETSDLRDRTGQERDISAQERDERSVDRDQLSTGRDKEAADLGTKDALTETHALGIQELRARARASRIRASNDRARAARDREQAANDRRLAAQDRAQAASDRAKAGTDDLTGARVRGVGLEELENEIRRARREGTSLVAAYVDVDGLKSVNDEQGHAAGDALLRAVADGLRGHIRDYDVLVRLGGDEFLCALPSVTSAEARQRFDEFRTELKDSSGASVSVGFSELRDGDSADQLLSRADGDLLAQRSR